MDGGHGSSLEEPQAVKLCVWSQRRQEYGWTDLLYSLVPTGRHLRGTPGDSPVPTDGSASEGPFGFVKQTIMTAFYAQSKIVAPIPTLSSRATFPSWFDPAYTCLSLWDPIQTNPYCATFRQQVAPGFINDLSAYYQNDFFPGLSSKSIQPVPVFSAGTLTDPLLFTSVEHHQDGRSTQEHGAWLPSPRMLR